MNELELPPRRSLSPELRDHLYGKVVEGMDGGTDGGSREVRQRSRFRLPAAVAASAAVLVAGAMIAAQAVNGTQDGVGAGGQPVVDASPIPPLEPLSPDAQTVGDLDRCGAVATASPLAAHFASRATWGPVFTVVKDGHRITAYQEYGGKPGFCDVTATTASVSHPSGEPMPLGASPNGELDVYGLYLSESGVLTGVGHGMADLEFSVTSGGQRRLATPVYQGQSFAVDLGILVDGDEIEVRALGNAGEVLGSFEVAFERAKVRPAGATATDR